MKVVISSMVLHYERSQNRPDLNLKGAARLNQPILLMTWVAEARIWYFEREIWSLYSGKGFGYLSARTSAYMATKSGWLWSFYDLLLPNKSFHMSQIEIYTAVWLHDQTNF